MPEDAAPGNGFGGIFDEFIMDLPGPTYPTMPTNPGFGRFEDLLDAFRGGDNGPGEQPPNGLERSLFDLLAELRGNEGPGSYPMDPAPQPPGFDLADLWDLRHPGVVETTPLPAEADSKPEPEWEGNVPPDLTDGFEFLL